ncbi:glycosyltransferase family 2 protein [Asticcacaulis sp. SL142]|uniref:glycosyltransferase family 2 protein n=1 Tax=Asticcacaulis sp. SL142 TaxID=2995155 RepID=UPI00226C99A4|nr:glycosyltransferase family 2 protein [Asticcacaulis sp. SL142]WAC49749.1 glycosyltransferase family 2 protein [Asticcacaulis sp. SL142]
MNNLIPDARNPSRRSRYHHAVVGIFRNEAHALAEWIEHYKVFGFDHIYLIDNASNDEYAEVIEPYLTRGYVSLFHCHRDGYQIGAYTELLPQIRAESEWIGAFDLDEFIYPTVDSNISAITERYKDQESVLIPWLSFGSNGHVQQPLSIVNGFTRRGLAHNSRSFLKAITRPAAIEYFSQHNPTTSNGRKVLANGQPFGNEAFIHLPESNVSQFQLLNNHYRLQSREYFQNVKTQRPEVHEDVVNNTKHISFFQQYDQKWNTVIDTQLRDRHQVLCCFEPRPEAPHFQIAQIG